MIKAAYNVHEEKKKAKGTKENPPTRYYWLWKKCCRAKSVCHVTEAAAANTPYSTLAVAFPRDARLPLWAVTDCCWLLVSGFITCGWVFLFAFSFLCNKKVSCIVPAHCFAACTLLSTSPRLAIIVEAKSGAGRRRKDEENPLHETVEHLFAQLIRELLLIVVYHPTPSNLRFDHVSFFPHIGEKVFVPFLLSKHSFSNHIVFGVWSERIDGNSSGGTIVLCWCLKEVVIEKIFRGWCDRWMDTKWLERYNPGISRSNKDVRNSENSA